MEPREHPGHLRPVPDSGDSTAPALEAADTPIEEVTPPPLDEAAPAVEDPARPHEETIPPVEEPTQSPPPPETAGEGPEPMPLVPGTTPGLTAPRARTRTTGFVTDVLVELGFASEERVKQAIDEARTAGHPPEHLLLNQGAISPEQLSKAVAERYGLDHVDLSLFQVDMAAANLISVSSARRYGALPIAFVDKTTLLVATPDPTNLLALDDIKMATGFDSNVAVSSREDIDSLIGRLNSLQSAVTEAVTEDDEAAAEEEEALAEASDMEVNAEDAPVVKLVYSILGQSVAEGASDVHFEPDEGEMRVRFRVDGVLREAAKVPKRMVTAVISRIKIMSDLNIAEKRIPQDGRVSVTIDERRIDLRVTTLPTQRGEGATIRILDKENAQRSLDDLGMDGTGRHRFEEAFRKAYGAVLVTGPTGSGKSTTLYAALQSLNEVEKNIITIEDPVEYRLEGINQINVNRKAGLDFATGLRSILRADPDIVMVGEIRDGETARIAIEAALTGHMMLTTLHTNDAPGAIARLNKMGIESFLTASAIDCVVAQRLARKLCTNCKQRAILPPEALAEAGIRVGVEIEAYVPTGCPRCMSTGYRGRVGIYSVMTMSERLKEMTVQGAHEAELTSVAREEGMVTLREDGVEKVRAGLTSLEEVLRVTA